MPQKECPICNKEFISTLLNRKYCSRNCSKKSISLFQAKYQKKYRNTERGKEINNKNYKTYQLSEKGKTARKRINDAWWADPEKREKKIQSFKDWSNKPNKKNIKDETGHLLTNMEVRNRTLKAGKKKEYNQRYFSSEKGKKTRSKNMSDYRRKNLKYRIALNMRHRVYEFLKIKKITKKNKTFEYVGCTPSELKSHLEKQFYNNPETNEPMTWMNWTLDGWHIDHRDPLDLAKNEEDAKRLCHYTNLQPMWAKENLKKGSKIKK